MLVVNHVLISESYGVRMRIYWQHLPSCVRLARIGASRK